MRLATNRNIDLAMAARLKEFDLSPGVNNLRVGGISGPCVFIHNEPVIVKI